MVLGQAEIIDFRESILGLEQSESIRPIRVELFWTQKVQYWTLKVNYCKNPLRAIRVAPGSKTHFEQSESPEQSESTPNTRTNEKHRRKIGKNLPKKSVLGAFSYCSTKCFLFCEGVTFSFHFLPCRPIPPKLRGWQIHPKKKGKCP